MSANNHGGKRQGSGAKKKPEGYETYRKNVPKSLFPKVKKECDELIKKIKDESKEKDRDGLDNQSDAKFGKQAEQGNS